MVEPKQREMAKVLYFDAYSGLSGDMTLGALLHLGMPLEYLREGLAKLGLEGYRLEMRPVAQHQISGIKLDVILDQTEHSHRPLSVIQGLIEASELPARVQERAKKVFYALAEAEGRIHNIAPDAVHFHEVGAVDAIVDIVGSCLGFEYFGIEEFYCSPLPLGSGFVQAEHGILPVPAPATLQLLAQWGASLAPAVTLGDGSEYPARAEMVTPTGAALVASLCQPPANGRPAMSLSGVGYGFGSREFAWPNALRLWLGTTSTAPRHSHTTHHPHEHTHAAAEPEPHHHDHHEAGATPETAGATGAYERGEVVLIETNLDDMTPEGLGYLLEKLMAAEALDVYFTPIQMKKNRPAIKLSVLARPPDETRLAGLILTESSTFGVRSTRFSRYMAGREFRRVETSGGIVQLKLKIIEGKVVEAVPEYESVAALARQTGRPWREIYDEIKHLGKRDWGVEVKS